MTITYTPQYRLANLGSFTAIPSTTLTTATFTSLAAGTSYDFRVIADNGIGQSTSVPFTQITTSVSESAQNASITQSNYTTSFIYDANLVQWSLQTPNSFSIYSSPPPYTALTQSPGTGSVTLLLYWNHTVYQQNSAGNWWLWNGTGWNATSDPRPTIVSVNLSNSSFPQGAGSGTVVGNVTVTENAGNTFSGTLNVTGNNSSFFTINSSNQLVTVGTVPAGGPWSINIVASSNQLAAQNSPFTQAESITETSAESIEGAVVNTIGPIMSASPNFGQASTGLLNQFELQTSVSSGNQIYINTGSGFVLTPSGGVSQLLYHNHTVFQENTALNWWYWNTTIAFPANNPWTAFSVNSVALNVTTYPSGATAGSQVGTISINETGDTFGGTFGGTLTLSGTNASTFKISGTNLVVNDGITLSTNTATNYNFTITATVASGGSTPTTIGSQNTGTITLTNSAASTATRPMVFGVINFSGAGQLTENPLFHTSIGYYPDVTSNNAGQSVNGLSGYSIYGNNGFPWVGAIEHFEFTDPTFNNPTAAANNDSTYVAAWKQAASRYSGLSGTANHTYAVRMCREWASSGWAMSPWYGTANGAFTPAVSAATWVAGFRNCVNAYRSVNPNLKICWDYPVGWDLNARGYNQTQALAFYPGDAYVDIISSDIYFPDNPPNAFYGDGTSAQAWLYTFGQANNGGYPTGFRMQDWAAFAANGFSGISAGGKPIAVPEWADCYQDGYIITKFLNWLLTPSTDPNATQHLNTTCVFHTYWDISLAGQFGNSSDPVGGRLQSTWAPNRYTNWVNFHKALASTYTGNFWPTYWPVPGTGTIITGY